MAIPLSRRPDFSEIPQIDVGPLREDTQNAELIEALRSACTDVGFFYVRNHGVLPELICALRREAVRFFEQPMAEKNKVRIDKRLRGYLPLDYKSYSGEERAAKSHQEGFWVGHERPVDARFPLDGPNLWPPGDQELKAAMCAYFDAVEVLSVSLLRGFSLSLGYGEDGLAQHFRKPLSRLKLNHYPPQDSPESVKHIGVVPHTDGGAFTILWQDEGDGLEIQNKSGEWIGAPSIENTFVINIGNILQRWTDGRFSSTPHRVINRGGRDRYSIPFFVNPDHDAPVTTLGAQDDAPGESEKFGPYVRDLWRKTFPIANIPA